MAALDIVLAEGSERFYHEVLEDSIETGSTFLKDRDTTPVSSSFFSQDCCKQHVGLVQLNQFCYSPSHTTIFLLHYSEVSLVIGKPLGVDLGTLIGNSLEYHRNLIGYNP
jgi:hypothetical protein